LTSQSTTATFYFLFFFHIYIYFRVAPALAQPFFLSLKIKKGCAAQRVAPAFFYSYSLK